MNLELNGRQFCSYCFKENSNTPCNCGCKENAPQFLAVGNVLNGSFCIGQSLCSSGYITDYLGYNPVNEVQVIVKEYDPIMFVERSGNGSLIVDGKFAEAYQAGMDYFIKRMQMLSMLKGLAGVPVVRSAFYENKTSYFILEKPDGVLMNEWQKSPELFSQQQAVKALYTMLSILSVLHERGEVHGNISENTVYVNSNSDVLMGGFEPAGDDISLFTEDTIIFDQPAEYISFSNFEKTRKAPSADIFSVGAVVYTLLTGLKPSSPFSGEARIDLDALKKTGCDNNLCSVLANMCDTGNQKYTNVDQVFHDLRSIFVKFGFSVSDTVQPISKEKESRRRPKLGKLKSTIVAFLILAILATGVVLFSVIKNGKSNKNKDHLKSEPGTVSETVTNKDEP